MNIKDRLKNLDFADLTPPDGASADEIAQWMHDNRCERETPAYRMSVKARLDRIIQDAQQALDHYLEEQKNERNKQRTPRDP